MFNSNKNAGRPDISELFPQGSQVFERYIHSSQTDLALAALLNRGFSPGLVTLHKGKEQLILLPEDEIEMARKLTGTSSRLPASYTTPPESGENSREIILIAAMTPEGVIGAENALPWKIPSEMTHFINSTRGSTVLMGRKTFESIGSKPLPGRRNIIATSKPGKIKPHENIFPCDMSDKQLEETFILTACLSGKERPAKVFIIGGSQIYNQFLPKADRILLSVVPYQIDNGDSLFPTPGPEWAVERISGKDQEENGRNPGRDFTVLSYTRPRNPR